MTLRLKIWLVLTSNVSGIVLFSQKYWRSPSNFLQRCSYGSHTGVRRNRIASGESGPALFTTNKAFAVMRCHFAAHTLSILNVLLPTLKRKLPPDITNVIANVYWHCESISVIELRKVLGTLSWLLRSTSISRYSSVRRRYVTGKLLLLYLSWNHLIWVPLTLRLLVKP